jgi:hypothetical protein
LAQRSSRKRRKERQRARTEEGAVAEVEPTEAAEPAGDNLSRGYARSRAKNDAAREALEPLKEGERPTAVIVAGVVALLLGLGNVVSYFAGLKVQGTQPSFAGIAVYSALMFAAAWGCFKLRYWAVLGMQALLVLGILIFSLLAVKAESVLALVIAVAVLLAAGTLFWFLIKSMARIQMPERPGADR